MSESHKAFLPRLSAARLALDALSTTPIKAEVRTTPDPMTGETWVNDNIWAHIHEFVPYWLEQISMVVSESHGMPIAFGRTKKDPIRIAAIHAHTQLTPVELWAATQPSLEAVAHFLSSLPEDAWNALGQHEILGTMGLHSMLNEFLVGHLEEHADQVRSLIDPS